MNRNRAAVERMAAQAVPTPEQLRRADPAPERELARILADPRLRIAPADPVRRRSWRPVLVVCAVLAVLGALVVLVPALHGGQTPTAVAPNGPAVAPTTRAPVPGGPLSYSTSGVETDPAVLLRQLADRAAGQTAPPRHGEVYYSRNLDGGQAVGATTPVRTSTAEFWTAPDGSGRTDLTPEGGDPEVADQRGPASSFPSGPLPADPAALEQAVIASYASTPHGPVLGTGDWFDDLVGRWHFAGLDPPVLAAYLRVLATKDGITVAGAVTDRLGRQGVAVTATSYLPPQVGGYETVGPDSSDLTLIFDPATGALLDLEEVSPAAPAANAPVNLYFKAWTRTAWVGAVGDRP